MCGDDLGLRRIVYLGKLVGARSVPLGGAAYASKGHAREYALPRLLLTAVLANLLNELRDGESDDAQARHGDADDDHHGDDLAKERDTEPCDARADVSSAHGELTLAEKNARGVGAFGKRRREREDRKESHEHHGESHSDAGGNALCLESNEKRHADGEEEYGQDVGADAERQVERG